LFLKQNLEETIEKHVKNFLHKTRNKESS